MKTFTGAINRLGPERHGSSRNLGGGIIAGVLGMLFLAGASVCLADSTDVTENLSYYPANTIRRSGTGFTVYADVDRDGSWDTLVALITVRGFAQNLNAASQVGCGNWSWTFDTDFYPGSTTTPSGQFAIRFVDMKDPNFNINNQSTWVYKSVAGVKFWTYNTWVACSTNASPYFQVIAYSEINQGGSIVYSQTYPNLADADRNFEIRTPLKEVFIHTDSCENELDCLQVLSAALPPNDLWSGATHLNNNTTYSMSTASATSTGDPVPTCSPNVSNTVWFAFTPASSRVVAVNTCGSDFDTVVQAYINSGGTLTPVGGGCNDDSNVCPGTSSRQSCIAFPATAGTTCYLMAGGWNGGSGNLSITASEVPIAITQQPAGGTAIAGGAFTFSVSATGPGLSYQWQLGGANWSGATDASFTITDLDPTLAGAYRVVISNVYGAVTSSVATLAVDPALALALDTTGLTWSTGGANGAWYREIQFSHDGVDDARCYGSASSPPWLQTTVTGPGTLSFYWGFAIGYFDTTSDYLSLLVDGVEVAKRNATRDPMSVHYSYQTIYLASGTHALRWAYDRNGGSFGGAYLDQVSYVSGGTAAFIATQPAPQTVVAGSNAVFTVTASGTPPITCQWQFAGVNLANATNNSLTLNNVQPIQAGQYGVVVANGYGSPVTSSSAALTATTIPLAAAVDYAGPVWSSSGNAQWFGQVSVAHDSADAAQSGWLTNSQNSYLDTTLVGPGTLKFWWKVSSETNWDFLRFYVGGVATTNISGEVDWQQQTVALPAGSQTLRWAYTKDGSFSRGLDAAWLDRVTYDGRPILSISSLPSQQVLLFWPTSVTSFVLMSATNLAGSWQSVPDVPAVRDDNWAVTNATGLRKFYRLKK